MQPKLELVHLSPTADTMLRWGDGSLKGLKTLVWKDRAVRSPLHKVVWEGGKLVAQEFYTGQGVRGEGGIHAIWPAGTKDNDAALREFAGYARRTPTQFTALVNGWGRCVMGDVGWRAEHCRIRVIISPPTYAPKLFRQWCFRNEVKWSVL